MLFEASFTSLPGIRYAAGRDLRLMTSQFVSCSWDQTVKVWNAYFKKGQRRPNLASADYTSTAMPTEAHEDDTSTLRDTAVRPKIVEKAQRENTMDRERPPLDESLPTVRSSFAEA